MAVVTAAVSALLARSGMRWFRTLHLPQTRISVAGMAIVWAVFFVFTDVSAIIAWDNTGAGEHPRLAAVYLVNAFLNAAWCYLFFVRHQIGSATLEAALLAIGIAVIVLEVFPVSLVAALLVVPFFIWVLFGMFVTLTIFRMNVR